MTSSWRGAFSTLTRLPVGNPTGSDVGARWFGVVGAVVGAAGLVPIALLGSAMPAAAAILALGTMAVLTGALHLDGLADTADALLALGPDAAERARNDPRIGAGGVTALLLVLGLQAASLATVASTSGAVVAGLTCLVAGATSRAVPLVVAVASHADSSGTGLGAAFVRQVGPVDAAVTVVSTLAIGLVVAAGSGGLQPVLATLTGLAAGTALGLAVVRLRGQLDGDGLGATVELGFAATVLAAAAIGRWPAT